jgi:tetratricopeptide (TPR) repeat protein
VRLGAIRGNEVEEFKEELFSAIESQGWLESPQDRMNRSALASLVVEGTYDAFHSSKESEETVSGKTKIYVDHTFSVRFVYWIREAQSGEEVISGELTESDSDREEKEELGFFASIFRAIVEAIFSGDPYSSLREQLAQRFVAEISPHQMSVNVVLFEDSDMPELESGISQARVGRWESALETFLDATKRYQSHKNLHKAYYNAGVAYEYTHQYSLAKEFMDRALQMSYEEEYARELRRCERYEQEWRWREGYLEKLRMMRREGN